VSGHVLLVDDGPFSEMVAAMLAGGLASCGWTSRRCQLHPDVAPERLLPGGDATVLISDRYDRSVVDRFDIASHGTRRPWLSVLHQHPYVQLGPYVDPYRGPCHACLRRRLTQHGHLDPVGELASASNAGSVSGLPPHLAVTVAGLALAILSSDGNNAEGLVFLAHVDGFTVSRLPVVAAHFCRRCGDGAGAWPPKRDNAAILAALRALRGRA
jgi:bacteriocin biosynthesis cyclodehydratase domain-containing protein